MRALTTALLLILSSSLLPGHAMAATTGNGLRAGGGNGHEAPRRAVVIPARNISLDEAVQRVRKRTGGRILDARTVERDGRLIHRIKVLTRDKRVRVIRFDAHGGGGEEE